MNAADSTVSTSDAVTKRTSSEAEFATSNLNFQPVAMEKQPDKSNVWPDNVVDFDGPDDPYRPINWPMWKKVVVTILYSLCTMGTTWASTMYEFQSAI